MRKNDSKDQLGRRVLALVESSVRLGADNADAVAVRSRSTHVQVRLGKIESTDLSEEDDVSLRVFVGNRVASVAASAGVDPEILAERAIAMAKVSPQDRYQGLAEEAGQLQIVDDLDLIDDIDVSAERLGNDALEMEEAALSVKGVSNSGGASAASGMGGMVLATSDGFFGHYLASRYSRSISVIAGKGTEMERDHDSCSRLHFEDLEAPVVIGERAAQRTVRRLGARKAATGSVPVIFDPRVARSIAGHLAASINGASVARKTSFFRDSLGEQIMLSELRVTDNPLRPRGSASRPFDGEGVTGRPMVMVDSGILGNWFLESSTARELGLKTNGRGSRRGSSISPSSTNFAIEPGSASPQDLIASVSEGFYVTEVFGQGVDMVSGSYSRGASGFWIKNGEISHPVSEVTIAANLKDMFQRLIAANDLDRNFATASPTLLIEGMILAGQ